MQTCPDCRRRLCGDKCKHILRTRCILCTVPPTNYLFACAGVNQTVATVGVASLSVQERNTTRTQHISCIAHPVLRQLTSGAKSMHNIDRRLECLIGDGSPSCPGDGKRVSILRPDAELLRPASVAVEQQPGPFHYAERSPVRVQQQQPQAGGMPAVQRCLSSQRLVRRRWRYLLYSSERGR